jgi:hypothetical protein
LRPGLGQGTNVGGRRADGRRENQNQTEVTGYQRFEPIRIDRASTETLAVDSCSVHQLPRSPARTPQEFSLCLRGRRIAQGVAALDAGGLHPIDGTTLYWPINLTFPFGCIICKTKPKYSNSSMGLRRLPRREICCEHSGDPDQPFQAIPITHSDRSRSVWRGVLRAPLDAFRDLSVACRCQVRREPVPVVNRRDSRTTRSAPMRRVAACVGGAC